MKNAYQSIICNTSKISHIKNEIFLKELSKTQNKKENKRENDNTIRIKYAKEGTGNKNDIIKIKGETLVFFENVKRSWNILLLKVGEIILGLDILLFVNN